MQLWNHPEGAESVWNCRVGMRKLIFPQYSTHLFTQRVVLFIVTSMLLVVGCSQSDSSTGLITTEDSGNPFSLGRVGNPQNSEAEPKPGVLLMGGSRDVDQAMRWLTEQSDNGDIVVIRATGADGYNQYLLDLGEANSVETLLINSHEAANDSRVSETIRKADALFIAGGDQSNYMNYWSNSETEEAIQYLIHERGVPIGGTSAGTAVMGEFVFTALNGGVTSNEALSNPFDERVTVQRSSLINHPLLKGVITDQHFSEREREGRTVVFIARIIEQYGGSGFDTHLRAVAVDERTALIIDENGEMNIMGENQVSFIYPIEENPDFVVFSSGEPFTWGTDSYPIGVFRADQNSVLSFSFLEKPGKWNELWNVQNGQLIRQLNKSDDASNYE